MSAIAGDDRVIRCIGRRSVSFDVSVEKLSTALAWVAFRVIRPDLLHDACGVNGEYQ